MGPSQPREQALETLTELPESGHTRASSREGQELRLGSQAFRLCQNGRQLSLSQHRVWNSEFHQDTAPEGAGGVLGHQNVGMEAGVGGQGRLPGTLPRGWDSQVPMGVGLLERVLGARACQVCSPVSGCGCVCVSACKPISRCGCGCVCWVCVCVSDVLCVSRAVMSLGVSIRHHPTPRC